jgi:hypothetical protein
MTKRSLFILVSATFLLGGCTLPHWFGKQTTNPKPTASPPPPSYQVQVKSNPTPSTIGSDEVKDMEKDMESIKIEDNFDAMVK